jgi:hypothetical protein
MKQYLASLFFEIQKGPNKGKQSFDEQFCTLSAETEAEAWQKAWKLGKSSECALKTSTGEDLFWSFVCVTHLYPLSTEKDGDLVFSQTYESPDGEELKEAMNLRSSASLAFIQNQEMHVA